MEDKNIDGVNLGEIFDNMKVGDPAYVATIEVARSNSVGVEAVERKENIEFVDMDKLRKSILKVVVTVVLGLVTLNAGWNMVDNMNSQIRMEDLSREIGSIVRQVDDPGMQTIVSQNTYRNENGPCYNHDGIAKDLLSLDSSLFDYAFCSVCNDMGNNLDNEISNGMTNIDLVIRSLKMYSSMEGEHFNQYVNETFRDVNSLNAYLIKNNYVDGGGNPSLDAFKTACDNNAEAIYDVIQSQLNNKGASL